jgi:hypothetical protein
MEVNIHETRGGASVVCMQSEQYLLRHGLG